MQAVMQPSLHVRAFYTVPIHYIHRTPLQLVTSNNLQRYPVLCNTTEPNHLLFDAAGSTS